MENSTDWYGLGEMSLDECTEFEQAYGQESFSITEEERIEILEDKIAKLEKNMHYVQNNLYVTKNSASQGAENALIISSIGVGLALLATAVAVPSMAALAVIFGFGYGVLALMNLT
ncbi:hypothetical protein RLOatenuis_5880 [Rickettsiales bacterium]|nr:hypothetical protein RLOatenuis_5880 [Rickettsiales bacterium]